jgi:hypothetical protein
MGINSDAATNTAVFNKSTTPESKPSTTFLEAKPAGPNKLYAIPDTTHGDWRDALIRDGYAVVKGAVPRDRALKYGDDMLSFLETL